MLMNGFKHKLKESQLIRIAYANGIRTAAEYAAYKKKNKALTHNANKIIVGEF